NDKPAQADAATAQPVQQSSAAATTATSATMTADRLHFDWQSKGWGKLVPSRIFDDGAAVYLAWNRETPLPAILTVSEDRKEGPLSYRMSGDYIVVSPVPQNMVLRYGDRMALLWTSRRVTAPPPPQPAAVPTANVAQRMATAAPAAPAPQPASSPAADGSAV